MAAIYRPAPLIGLCGYATAGKDVFADGLVKHCNYEKLGFADPMYAMMFDIDPYVSATEVELDELDLLGVLPAMTPTQLSAIAEKVEHDVTLLKKIEDVRVFLQRLGKSARDRIARDIWVNTLFAKVDWAPHKPIVITNIRYSNEADALFARGGDLILIKRPGVGPVNNHESESGEVFDRATYVVTNDGAKEDFELHAKDVVNRLITGV